MCEQSVRVFGLGKLDFETPISVSLAFTQIATLNSKPIPNLKTLCQRREVLSVSLSTGAPVIGGFLTRTTLVYQLFLSLIMRNPMFPGRARKKGGEIYRLSSSRVARREHLNKYKTILMEKARTEVEKEIDENLKQYQNEVSKVAKLVNMMCCLIPFIT